MHFLQKLILFAVVLIKGNECFNILMIAPIKSFSHIAPQVELAKALVKRGHAVTFISPQPLKEEVKDLRKITVNIPTIIDSGSTVPIFEIFRQPITNQIDTMLDFGLNSTEGLLSNSNIKELLANPKEKFDVVIFDHFSTYALHGFCHHFEAHCIIYSALRIHTFIKPLIGDVAPLSYSADSIMSLSQNLSFFQRLYNIYIFLYSQFVINFKYLPKHNDILRRYFKGAPDINDMIYNISLVLQNSHMSINYPAPEAPNVIEIGGFHINPEETGSKEIQDILDSNQEVIYFSFGSVLKSRLLPLAKLNALFEAFSKLNATILWKFEAENLEGKPDNVKIVRWAPQKYILAHPNVKLFISHGGLFSTMEAVYFGKPILGIPIFGDQESNMMYLESIGMGKYINFDHLTGDQVVEYVNDILQNTSFSEKAQENSRLLKDQPMHPMDKAIYWIEFIQRHKGGSRLALEGLKLPLYKLLHIDIIFLLFSIFPILLLLIVLCIKFSCFMIRWVEESVELDKKKKN